MSTLYEYGNSTVLYNGSSSCTSIVAGDGLTGNELVYGAIYHNSNFDWNSYVDALNLGSGSSCTGDWAI